MLWPLCISLLWDYQDCSVTKAIGKIRNFIQVIIILFSSVLAGEEYVRGLSWLKVCSGGVLELWNPILSKCAFSSGWFALTSWGNFKKAQKTCFYHLSGLHSNKGEGCFFFFISTSAAPVCGRVSVYCMSFSLELDWNFADLKKS